MTRLIQWQGNGIRLIHGYNFTPGQAIEVEDDEIALDILTQPNEPFVEIEVEAGIEAETNEKKSRRKAGALAKEE